MKLKNNNNEKETFMHVFQYIPAQVQTNQQDKPKKYIQHRMKIIFTLRFFLN